MFLGKPDRTHLVACHTLADALFYTGEFGGSLVHSHRGLQGGNVKYFKPLVLVNQETVEDCVGQNVPPDMLKRLMPKIEALFAHRAWLFERLNDEPDEFEGIAVVIIIFYLILIKLWT